MWQMSKICVDVQEPPYIPSPKSPSSDVLANRACGRDECGGPTKRYQADTVRNTFYWDNERFEF
jgi:hypothetical protein